MISLYVHIPFCLSKCHYCDFNSIGIGQKAPPEQDYVEALGSETRRWKKILRPQACQEFESVFFGGGTPSMLSVTSIAKILELGSSIAPLRAQAEVSLELNPKTASLEKMVGFYRAGINRLSIGVQSLDDDLLQGLVRAHSARDALDAMQWAFEAGFDQVSADLMYGLPGQDRSMLQKTFKQLRDFPLRHLSAYELIIEEHTPFGDAYGQGRLTLPGCEEVEEMRRDVTGFALEKGMQPYEISNYAQSGHESRHNRHYWNYDSYVGLGAGAVSFFRCEEIDDEFFSTLGNGFGEELYGYRCTNPRSKETYEKTVSDLLSLEVEPIPLSTAMAEFMMVGLRKIDGIRYGDFEEKFSRPLPGDFFKVIEKSTKRGWVKSDSMGCRLSEQGILFSNEVMQEFFPSR